MSEKSIPLRTVLAADAAMCVVAGLVLAVGAGMLAELLSLPVALLREAGLILLPWGLFVAWIASRNPAGRRLVLAVVVVNLLWAVDSVLLLASGWVAPNGLGVGFVLVQAAASAGLALLQGLALPAGPRLQRA